MREPAARDEIRRTRGFPTSTSRYPRLIPRASPSRRCRCSSRARQHWGAADAFRFHWTDAFGPLSRIAARVLSIENTNAWAKAGVMIREDFTSPGSRHVMVIVSPGKGVAMQYRATPNGRSSNVAVVAGVAPMWVRLTRQNSTFIGEMSVDGRTWSELGRVNITMHDSSQAGLAVTSHNNATLATAVFDDIVIDRVP